MILYFSTHNFAINSMGLFLYLYQALRVPYWTTKGPYGPPKNVQFLSYNKVSYHFSTQNFAINSMGLFLYIYQGPLGPNMGHLRAHMGPWGPAIDIDIGP